MKKIEKLKAIKFKSEARGPWIQIQNREKINEIIEALVLLDSENEKWKLKCAGLVRQMEGMDKAFKERVKEIKSKAGGKQ